MLDISVVISTYTEDRWQDLLAAIASVRAQSLQPRELIVVVDHHRDLAERVRAQCPDLRVVESSQPRGLSGARNSGSATARGAVVAFLDDDAVAESDWLAWLAAAYTDRRVLGVGGVVEPVWSAGRPRWFPDEFGWVVGCTYHGMPLAPAPVRNLIGANMSVRRDVLDALSGFRHGIGRSATRPLGCEETELCIRARQRWPDGRFVYDPRARVHHRVPPGRASWAYFRRRCYAEGLSKARVTRFVGTAEGLASEWRYTLSVLPRGVVHATVRRAPAGLERAAAIIAGLAFTATGYFVGALSGWALPATPADGAAE